MDIMVEILPYRPEFREMFERLNRQWLEEYSLLEPVDLEYLQSFLSLEPFTKRARNVSILLPVRFSSVISRTTSGWLLATPLAKTGVVEDAVG